MTAPQFPRPAGRLGYIDVGDWSYLAVETGRGNVFYQPLEHRPDFWILAPLATFRERPEGEHGSWCDVAESDTLCPTCAREAHPDWDEVA